MTESMTILLISVLSVTGFLTIVVLLVIYRRFRLTDKWDVKPEDVIFNPKTKHEEFSPEGSTDLPRTSRTTIIAGTMGNLYLPKKKFCQIAVMKGLIYNEFQQLSFFSGKHPRLLAIKKINRFGRIVLDKKDEKLVLDLGQFSDERSQL